MRILALACLLSLLSTVVGCSSSDAAAGATDGAVTDVGGDASFACVAPLTDVATFDEPPLSAWCAKDNGLGGSRSTKTCDGYLAILIGEGVDCSTLYLFDPTTKKLVGELRGCNLRFASCTQGPATFRAPSDACIKEGGFGFDTTPVCPPRDAGVEDAGDIGDASHD